MKGGKTTTRSVSIHVAIILHAMHEIAATVTFSRDEMLTEAIDVDNCRAVEAANAERFGRVRCCVVMREGARGGVNEIESEGGGAFVHGAVVLHCVVRGEALAA